MENINNEEERVIEQVEFETEDGQKILMSVIEETTIAGVDYILVSSDFDDESEEGEIEVLPLKLIKEEGEIASYETIEDEEELAAVSEVFAKLLSEDDIELDYLLRRDVTSFKEEMKWMKKYI